MERGNTKPEIREASLDRFSVQDFEATSIAQTASAAGIRKAWLYSHFESKPAYPAVFQGLSEVRSFPLLPALCDIQKIYGGSYGQLCG